MRTALQSIRLRHGLHVGTRQHTSKLHRPPCIRTGDVCRVIFYLVVFGSQEGVAAEQEPVVALHARLALVVLSQQSLFLLLAHIAAEHPVNEEGVSPAQHLASVSRLPELESETVGNLQFFSECLALFLLLGKGGCRCHKRQYDEEQYHFDGCDTAHGNYS